MPNIKQIVLQEYNESVYSRKHIDRYIREEIQASSDMCKRLVHGIGLVRVYMGKTYYASKNARIKQLVGLDLEELVTDIFVGIAYFQREELFTSVTAQLAGRLKFSDKTEAITTVAELVAVLCATDAFDINKSSKSASLMVQSRIPLSDKLIGFIENSAYLPPMVCEPMELTNNYTSGYLSHNDGLILGAGNMHDGDICLDVLNLMNKVQLRLDTEFLSKFEEEPTFELDTPDKADAWKHFKTLSYKFYMIMASNGNKFYLTHKVDKRGRVYASGYHISTQGTAFKKASIELAQQEVVTGVPH